MMRARSNVIFGASLALALAALSGVLFFAIYDNMLLAVGMILFVIAVVAALSSFNFALIGLILATAFEGIYKDVAPGIFTLLVKDFFVIILLGQLAWRSHLSGRFDWTRLRLSRPAFLFMLYCMAMMFSPAVRSFPLALAGFRAWVVWMPVFFPLWFFLRNRKQIVMLLGFIIAVHIPLLFYGLVQGRIGYHHTSSFPGTYYQRSLWYGAGFNPVDEYGNPVQQSEAMQIMPWRARSFFTSPGDLGAISLAITLLSLGMLAFARTLPLRLLSIAAVMAGIGGLLASGSRTPMVALVPGIIVLTMVPRRRGIILIGTVLMLFSGFYVLRDIAATGYERLETQLTVGGSIRRSMRPLSYGLELGLQYPLGMGIAGGAGAGRLLREGDLHTGIMQDVRFVENEYGRALMELGFVGTAIWLWMLFSAVYSCFLAVRQMGAHREAMLGAGMLAQMASIIAMLLTGSALYLANAGLYFWIFAAATLRLRDTVDLADDEDVYNAYPDKRATLQQQASMKPRLRPPTHHTVDRH